MSEPQIPQLPPSLATLRTLALDLGWTWSHAGDEVWRSIDAAVWDQTHNPWVLLQNTSPERLRTLAADPDFMAALNALAIERDHYLRVPGWFRGTPAASAVGGIAYFSMEFGLGEALPLYAGGLGMLAGDYLKTASDLDVPVIGIGLLYQEGYFHQVIDASGKQQEFYPYNEPAALPIVPMVMPDGSWLRITIELPGRDLQLRVWRANVGRVSLYLLDGNYALNSPADRGITAKLYEAGAEIRLLQEIVLGVGGWRLVEALAPATEICHINEGHAAFAIIERARLLAGRAGLDFDTALWATRAGNIFTSHTPVAAAFDRFPADLVRKYLTTLAAAPGGAPLPVDEVMALGRASAGDGRDVFNMAFLAARGSAMTVGVSRLHGEVSRDIFQPLFPRWPTTQVPIGHVTNGVHVPSWDSAGADRVWTEACGKDRWRSPPDASLGLAGVTDETLWAVRGEGRLRVVEVARHRLGRHLRQRGAEPDAIGNAQTTLDPNILTIGFARRFTEYKRPNLLLRDPARLQRLLLDEARPVQIIVAGKAHPADLPGKAMIKQWFDLARLPQLRHRVVFLEDYDIALAQEMVQGLDLWINTPRRPWEACGTSGMKVLVGGGINCSVLDGWWDEAFEPAMGWAVGSREPGTVDELDRRDTESLYTLLESQIVPEFYSRDANGLPRAWLGRVRASMAGLTPRFSSARMLRDYLETAYVPLAGAVRQRAAGNYALAHAMSDWATNLRHRWPGLHIGNPTVTANAAGWDLAVPVVLGDIEPGAVRVEALADRGPGQAPQVVALTVQHPMPGTINGFVYAASIAGSRPIADYTVRVVAAHDAAVLPAELPLIAWQR